MIGEVLFLDFFLQVLYVLQQETHLPVVWFLQHVELPLLGISWLLLHYHFVFKSRRIYHVGLNVGQLLIEIDDLLLQFHFLAAFRVFAGVSLARFKELRVGQLELLRWMFLLAPFRFDWFVFLVILILFKAFIPWDIFWGGLLWRFPSQSAHPCYAFFRGVLSGLVPGISIVGSAVFHLCLIWIWTSSPVSSSWSLAAKTSESCSRKEKNINGFEGARILIRLLLLNFTFYRLNKRTKWFISINIVLNNIFIFR